MSGYGGNLTYPDNKQFRNSFGIINDPGVAGQEFRLVVDQKIQVGANARTLFIESTGDYIPGEVGATVTRVDHLASAAKVSVAILENRSPADISTHELGFIQKAIAQHPGVMNDNFYGQLRTYAHKFDYLDPITAGLISDLDLMRAYADINQQITDDTGRYNGHLTGNYEAVIDAHTTITLSAVIGSSTYNIPGAGLYGVSAATALPYVGPIVVAAASITSGATSAGDTSVTVAKADGIGFYIGQAITFDAGTPLTNTVTSVTWGATNTTIGFKDPILTTGATTVIATTAYAANSLTNVGVETPGYGYEIIFDGAQTITAHLMKTTTKVQYHNLYTHQLQEVDGVVTTEVAGNFELLPWEEVYREFAHMGHDVPLSNHWNYEKPSNVYSWTKFILEANHYTGTFHGASHGGSYKERMVLFVADNGATTGVAGCVADLATLLATWITA